MRAIYIFLFFVIFIIVSINEKVTKVDPEVADGISAAETVLPYRSSANRVAITSYMKVDGVKNKIHEWDLNRLLDQQGWSGINLAHTLLWNFPRDIYGKPSVKYFGYRGGMAGTAYGTDKKHHFFNSYLLGYEPFKTDKVWVPLYTLAYRKEYQLDEKQYVGKADVWQTSVEAFKNTRGDCEDHAIVLADWLIAMGEDARVVLGMHKSEGHAWVVLMRGKKTYLLEPTSKDMHGAMKSLQPASLAINYHPDYMFNRESFWVNTGSARLLDYQSPKWVLKSHYYY